MKHTYTHTDARGMRWRFVGNRPVSELADLVMAATRMLPKAPNDTKKPHAFGCAAGPTKPGSKPT